MYALVLAGGAGSRFWPASRRARPKPFVQLVGEDSLLGTTLTRLERVAEPGHTFVVSAASLAAPTRATLERHPAVRPLLEPVPRNTAAAIAWGAAQVCGEDPDALVGVFPADHHIPAPAAFARSLRAAASAARRADALVLVGIEPTRPDTAYGYLRLGRKAVGSAREVVEFREKPSAARARRYVASGDYLWNAGMVVARAARILEECRLHAPEIWTSLGPVLEAVATGRPVPRRRLAEAYDQVEPLSFDYAVLERTPRRLAVPGRFRWSDLGSWDALAEHLPARSGNRVAGRAPVVNNASGNNVVWNQAGKPIALLGIESLIVVETEDALLLCSLDRAQQVREVVEKLSEHKCEDLT